VLRAGAAWQEGAAVPRGSIARPSGQMDNSFETGILLTLLRTPPLMGYALTIQEVYCFAKLYFRIASKFQSPRFEYCDCKRHKTATFRPLSALLTEPVAPELLYMEAKWSSLVSYGLSLDALQDFLPIALSLDVKTVRYDTLKVAKRLEAELGE